MTDSLTALDGTFLELEEADESAHMHIGTAMVFAPTPAAAPTLAEIRALIDERLAALPRYSQRLSQPHTGGLHWPSWEPDPDFSIADHVHEAALPHPAGERELLDWAADYWSTRLDRRRPLWDAVVIKGLARGRWTVVTKTHHALTDGIGAVDVTNLLLDEAPEPAPRSPEPAPAPGEGAPAHGLLRSGIEAALHPSKLKEALERSAAMVDLIVRDEVIAAPRTSLNVPIGTRRRFEVVKAELADLKRVKNALGGTVNDVVLAIACGALRRLLLERGEEPPGGGMRAMVPVSVRAAAGHLKLGNKVTSLFVHLPVAEPDPLRRYRVTVGNAESLKSGSQAIGGSTAVELASLAPPALHSFLARSLFASRLFNVTITNVPGPPRPLYAFGAQMEEVYPLVPLAAEHAVGIAVVSYADRVFFGLHGDDRAMADLDVLRDAVADSLAELLALAGPEPAGSGAATPAKAG